MFKVVRGTKHARSITYNDEIVLVLDPGCPVNNELSEFIVNKLNRTLFADDEFKTAFEGYHKKNERRMAEALRRLGNSEG